MADPTTTDEFSATREELELEKIALETAELKRRASWRGQLTDWLQAAAIPASIAGIVFTFFFSSSQLHQAEDARADDRFDKALTRLAAPEPASRISAVSGLRLFISNGEVTRRADAVQFLIDALANETNPVVQNGILDVIGGLGKQGIDKATLDTALASAIASNRSLTHWLEGQVAPNDAAIRQLLIKRHELDPDDLKRVIPDALTAKLSKDDFRNAIDSDNLFSKRIDLSGLIRLTGLASAIESLIKQGATADNFSGIFCEGCNFTPANDLSGANFDGAHLHRADFSHMILRNAYFRNTDLSGANFFAAHLEGGHLNTSDTNAVARKYQGYAAGPNVLPIMECAHLEGADLSGLPVIVVLQTRTLLLNKLRTRTSVYATALGAATMDDHTQFDRLGIVYERIANAAYLDSPQGLAGDDLVDNHIRDTAMGHNDFEGVFRWYSYTPSELSEFSDTAKRFVIFERDDFRTDQNIASGLIFLDDSVASLAEKFLALYFKQRAFEHVPKLSKFAQPGAIAESWIWAIPKSSVCEGTGYPPLRSLIVSNIPYLHNLDPGTR